MMIRRSPNDTGKSAPEKNPQTTKRREDGGARVRSREAWSERRVPPGGQPKEANFNPMKIQKTAPEGCQVLKKKSG